MAKISNETRNIPGVVAEYAKGKHYTNCGAFLAYIARSLGGKGFISNGVSAGMKGVGETAKAWVLARPRRLLRPGAPERLL